MADVKLTIIDDQEDESLLVNEPFVLENDDEDGEPVYRVGYQVRVETFQSKDGKDVSFVEIGNGHGGGSYPIESDADLKINKNNGTITFKSRGTIYTVRGFQDTDGAWASQLAIDVPAEALKEMTIMQAKTRYKGQSGADNDEELYAAVDPDSREIKYVIYSSPAGMYTRSSGGWFRVPPGDTSLDGLEVNNIDQDFIETFDKADRAGETLTADDLPEVAAEEKPVTAAAGDACPVATQDIATNLKNREKAIKDAKYGPLNPEEPNPLFWAEKARRWNVAPREAKKSLCGNCVMFIRTPSMLDCISSGIEAGGSGKTNAWDAIDQAELGYCEAFDFKCAASRTCDAWVTGGPITEEETE